MFGDPLRHVRPGERMRIPATAYNAFVDAAKAERKGRIGTKSGSLSTANDYDILIHNGGETDLTRFSVVCIGDPLTLPSDRLESFQAVQSYEAVTPSLSKRGKFVILQEPARAGSIARARATGLSVVKVALLAPTTTDDDFADIVSGQTGHLGGAAHGRARILWTEPVGERLDANKPWCVVALGDNGPGEEFAVKVTIDGGAAGNDSSTCSWTYSVESLRGKVVGSGMSPAADRLPEQEYAETPDDSEGMARYSPTGELVLVWANELPLVNDCEAGGGDDVIDGGGA